MKRILSALFTVTMVACMVACAAKPAEPQPLQETAASAIESEQTPEPASEPMPQHDKMYLEQDEYSAFRGDEVVTSIPDLGRIEDRCEFSWFSSLFDIAIEELSTKRGISVGSTLEDIADAYEGVHFTGGTIGGETIYDEPIANLVESLDADEPAEIRTWSYFKMRDFMLGEGVAITGEKEVDELKASGECLSMELIFRIEDGIVSEISLYANEK